MEKVLGSIPSFSTNFCCSYRQANFLFLSFSLPGKREVRAFQPLFTHGPLYTCNELVMFDSSMLNFGPLDAAVLSSLWCSDNKNVEEMLFYSCIDTGECFVDVPIGGFEMQASMLTSWVQRTRWEPMQRVARLAKLFQRF